MNIGLIKLSQPLILGPQGSVISFAKTNFLMGVKLRLVQGLGVCERIRLHVIGYMKMVKECYGGFSFIYYCHWCWFVIMFMLSG